MIFVIADTKAAASRWASEVRGLEARDYRALTLRSPGVRGRTFRDDDEFVVLPLGGTESQRQRLVDELSPAGPPEWVLRRVRGEEEVRPWYYRRRFTNWLLAAPWRWDLWGMYRHFRVDHPDPRPSGTLHEPAHGRLRSAWLALTFPHVHHESEEQ